MDWLRARQPREQRILGLGGAAITVLVLWVVVFSPLAEKRASLLSDLDATRAERAELEQRAPILMGLGAGQSAGGVARSSAAIDRRSLPALIDADLRRAGLASAIRDVSPDGERLRLRLEAVEYAALLAWLDALLIRGGLDVERFELRARDEAGRVDAELTFVVRERAA